MKILSITATNAKDNGNYDLQVVCFGIKTKEELNALFAAAFKEACKQLPKQNLISSSPKIILR